MERTQVRPQPPTSLIRWGDNLDTLFHDFWDRAPQESPGLLCPAVDVAEDNASLRITAELPGIERKDVSLEVKDGVLTLRAEKRQETETKGRNALRIERRYGSFFRALSLPETVEASRIEAVFRNGVLTVTIPKREETKPRTVAIKE
jgi:HSP20 family protein